MKNDILLKWFFIVLIITAAVSYIGCEKKYERAEHPNNDKVTADVDTTKDFQDEPEDTIVVAKIIIPELKGKWSGTFDKRSTVLNITEQTDSSFLGKITISYRQVLNQEVKGLLSPTTSKMTMTDQLHSRYQGKYSGSLSKNADNFSGTFTMDHDGTKYSFNLTKK